jgi:integration host factor subunit alpha
MIAHAMARLAGAAGLTGVSPRIIGEMETLTRARIAESLHENLGLSKEETFHLLESVLQAIIQRLECHEPVKVSGFGTFATRRKCARRGRNPKTMVEVTI